MALFSSLGGTSFSINDFIYERSEEHTSELQSRLHLVCRLLLEKKKGTGLFTFSVPDTYELAQLRRFANRPKLAQFEQKFTQLVLRTTAAHVATLFPAIGRAHV